MKIIKITKAPEGFAHTMHDGGFAVLDWKDSSPVVALHGQRVALDDSWRWDEIDSER